MIAGVRASSFEEGALYWHEGLDEWKPVREFPDSETPGIKDWRRVMPRDLPAAPKLPAKTREADPASDRPRRSRAPKPPSRQLGRGGRAIFLGIALLAALLMMGILLLLMRI